MNVRWIAIALVAVLTSTSCMRKPTAQPPAGTPSGSTSKQGANRGPGMRRSATESLQLPVPRTLDLSHVEPAHFAAALGNDPLRIFQFVRDEIGYEAYIGYLRGPRGTLMAMAGNSVDRAALLGSLLEHSGQRVRYARGSLREALAQELIASMWPERPGRAVPQVQGEPSEELKLVLDAFPAGIRRDYPVLRDYLRQAGHPASRASIADLEPLVKSAQDHYWVQWLTDGRWVDLDPSFGDATPGQVYGQLAETFETWPDGLFHRVVIRIWLEEYTGDRPSRREILQFVSKAADLSGVDLILTHQPEQWSGPAESFQSPLAASADDTGKVKPILFIPGRPPVVGDPFRRRAPGSPGAGAVVDILGGQEGTKVGPIATSESVEFEFFAPDGRKDTVVREIFDLVSEARRARGQSLTEEEVLTATQSDSLFDVTDAVYSLFFTTGAIDTAHLQNLSLESSTRPPEEEAADVTALLRRINIVFAATSDALITRLSRPDGSVYRFFQDSPRLQITEVAPEAGAVRLTLDLRRDRARGVGTGLSKEALFFSQVLRGVVDGTLERVLMDYVNIPRRDVDARRRPVLSTSLIFERAHAEAIPLILLARESTSLAPEIPEDTRSLLDQALAAGYLVLAPQRPIVVTDTPRLAWWQIDPRSGETSAVTDEGMHGSLVEYKVIINKKAGTGIIWMSAGGKVFDYVRGSAAEIYRIVDEIRKAGQFLGTFSWMD